MSDNLLKIRRRLSSVTATRKITNAMELVSSSKLTKKRRMLENVVDYAKMVEAICLECLKSVSEEEEENFPLLLTHPNSSKTLYVVITSSLGLCGGYNFNLIKYLNSILKEGDEVVMIGTKGLKKIEVDNVGIDKSFLDISDKFTFNKVQKLEQKLGEVYTNGEYNKVTLVYTAYKNALTFIPTSFSLLPFIPQKDENYQIDYPPIFCPNSNEVFSLLIPKYLDSVLYEKIAEALVSEEASRRNAMENATDNADELIDELQITYNKARQASITSQITEIVSGRLEED